MGLFKRGRGQEWTFKYIVPGARKSSTYHHRRAVIDIHREHVASRLLQLVHVGTFDGLLKVGMLSFFRTRRRLVKRLYRTQWWYDLRRGKPCSKGSVIFRRARRVHGRSLRVTVHENCGDITVDVCHPMTGSTLSALFTEENVRDALLELPGMLDFWCQCMKSCRYSQEIVRAVLNKCRFLLNVPLPALTKMTSEYMNCPSVRASVSGATAF